MKRGARKLAVICLVVLPALSLSLLYSPPAKASPVLVQTASVSSTNTDTSVAASFSAGPQTNNLLIAVCGAQDPAIITGPSGFSTAINESGTPSQAIFYKIATSSEGISFGCSIDVSTRVAIHIYEYSGLAISSPLDAVNSVASTGTSSTPNSGSVTTSSESLLIAGVTINTNTSFSSWGSSFTERNDFSNGGSAGSRSTYGGATRVTSSSGTYSTTASAGASGSWRGQIAAFKLPDPGVLSVEIVDTNGDPIAGPSMSFSSINTSFACQTATSTLGTNAERVRVTNTTTNGNWTLTIAATNGTSSVWSNGQKTYDYNDGGGAVVGCADGGDADSVAGQLTVNPLPGTVLPQSGCSDSGITIQSSSAFSDTGDGGGGPAPSFTSNSTDTSSTVTAITLLSASGSQTNCYFDLIDVSLSQTIPAEVPASGGTPYTINMTLTVTAN